VLSHSDGDNREPVEVEVTGTLKRGELGVGAWFNFGPGVNEDEEMNVGGVDGGAGDVASSNSMIYLQAKVYGWWPPIVRSLSVVPGMSALRKLLPDTLRSMGAGMLRVEACFIMSVGERC
jgi:hypothetical protein